MVSETIRRLKEQHGPNSPAVAEQLNSMGVELQRRGDARTALKFHQEALTILEWNKCNAILYEFAQKAKEYAIQMASTLRKIGNLLREMNNFVGAAEVYKECLDTFLEGLVEGGGGLKRRLLEAEYKRDLVAYHAVLDRVDRKRIGRTLCLHQEFRAVVRDISQLFREMQCVKFVGQNAASSRRRRRHLQHAAMEENLKNAVESLSMSTDTNGIPERSNVSGNSGDAAQNKQLNRSMSWSSSMSGTSDTEAWMRSFWEKECGRYSRPRPLSRRAVTSEEEYDHYKALSSMIVPAEHTLHIALNRFPLPESVTGDDTSLRQSSNLEQSFSMESLQEASSRDAEERTAPPPHHLAAGAISPKCVAQPVFQEDILFKPGSL